jgi:hypothetical protein
MSENQKEEYATARQEIEKLRSENSKLREDWLEATDALMSYTRAAWTDAQDWCRDKQLKLLLVRAADALEKSPDGAHSQLVQELRRAAE